jgi:hypothetical protein
MLPPELLVADAVASAVVAGAASFAGEPQAAMQTTTARARGAYVTARLKRTDMFIGGWMRLFEPTGLDVPRWAA